MFIRAAWGAIKDFFTEEDGPSIPPVQYRGYAKDYEALERDRSKLSGAKPSALGYRGFAQDYMTLSKDASKIHGDMQRGWEKTKARYHLGAHLK